MKYLVLMTSLFLATLIQPVAADEYLGKLSANPYDPDSTANPYGQYGSEFSPDSINNPYGRYGSPYSPDSATKWCARAFSNSEKRTWTIRSGRIKNR